MGPEAVLHHRLYGGVSSHLALALKEEVMDGLHQLQASLDL